MTELVSGLERWAIALMWVTFWFFEFKEGFVRHETGHPTLFFQALVGGFIVFRWRIGHRAAAIAGLATLMSFALAAAGESLGTRVGPIRSARTLVQELGDLASQSQQAKIMMLGRVAIQNADPLDAASLALLRGHTVAPYPTELSVAWAYGLNWDPLPVLQSYQAYTAELDRTDERFLASANAPQRILLKLEPGIDGRVLSFDQPETDRTILCRYREVHASSLFAILAPGGNRCSAPRVLTVEHADWGEPVRVPKPSAHSLVFVRISGIDVHGFERIRAFLFKPAERFVLLNGLRYRLVPGTAGDGLPLVAAPGVDWSRPFNFAVGASTIAVAKQSQGPTGGKPITYSFYVERFSGGAS